MGRYWAAPAAITLAIIAASALPGTAFGAARPATHTHPLIGPPSGASRPATGTAPVLGTQTQSANWSGYDDSTEGPFTSVTASWIQPAVKFADATLTDTAFWVGLDGDNSDTVEQIGTEGYSEGVVGYDAWFEMYPAAPVTLDMTISPGDLITATVTESGVATFTLSLVDHTSGATFTKTTTTTYVPQLASAEVIAEAPTDSNGDVVPLADFRTVTFSDCAFNGQPIGAYDWNAISMISYDTGAPVDKALPLSPDGTSFSVTTDVTPPFTRVLGADSRWHRLPVTLHFLAKDNPGGTGVAYTEYSLDDGSTWTKADSVTIPAPADHSNDGAHKVVYRSADNAGNLEARRFCTVCIDTSPPTPLLWPATAEHGGLVRLRFRVNDPRPGSSNAAVTIRIKNARGRLVKRIFIPRAPVDRSLGYRFTCLLPKGRYGFTMTATDAAGNHGTTLAASTLVVR
jgi:hypothetical protein